MVAAILYLVALGTICGGFVAGRGSITGRLWAVVLLVLVASGVFLSVARLG